MTNPSPKGGQVAKPLRPVQNWKEKLVEARRERKRINIQKKFECNCPVCCYYDKSLPKTPKTFLFSDTSEGDPVPGLDPTIKFGPRCSDFFSDHPKDPFCRKFCSNPGRFSNFWGVRLLMYHPPLPLQPVPVGIFVKFESFARIVLNTVTIVNGKEQNSLTVADGKQSRYSISSSSSSEED